MNNLSTESQVDLYTEETLVIVRNLLRQQFADAPSHGAVVLEARFHGGELCRIITRNEMSTIFSPAGEES